MRLQLGHPKEAADVLKLALSMDIEDINAKLQQEDAQELLRQLQRSGKLGMVLHPSSQQAAGTNMPPLAER